EIIVSSFDVSFRLIDAASVDKDKANVLLNGKTLFNKQVAGSSPLAQWTKIPLQESSNLIEIQGISSGKDGNNTATLEIRDDKTGKIQRLSLRGKQKAEKANLIVNYLMD
ncbi:MAG: hypothetical protein ACKVTZ_09920, partial [Bacteroidia bacterium]